MYLLPHDWDLCESNNKQCHPRIFVENVGDLSEINTRSPTKSAIFRG